MSATKLDAAIAVLKTVGAKPRMQLSIGERRMYDLAVPVVIGRLAPRHLARQCLQDYEAEIAEARERASGARAGKSPQAPAIAAGA